MKNLQLSFAFLLALVASSFSLPTTQPAAFPEDQPLPVQTDYYLKIEGVDGESTAADHKGWLEVESYQLHPSAKTATFRRKTTPVASPVLMQFCAQGKHIKNAVLHQRTAPNSNTFLTIQLENVMITSYQTSGDSQRPMESFSLNYAKASRR